MKGYIYKITNLLNGKIYIGQTRQSIQTRWEQHCFSPYVCHFHQAIQKYGRNNFQVEEICCVDLPEKELEQTYAEIENSEHEKAMAKERLSKAIESLKEDCAQEARKAEENRDKIKSNAATINAILNAIEMTK